MYPTYDCTQNGRSFYPIYVCILHSPDGADLTMTSALPSAPSTLKNMQNFYQPQ